MNFFWKFSVLSFCLVTEHIFFFLLFLELLGFLCFKKFFFNVFILKTAKCPKQKEILSQQTFFGKICL